MPINFINQGFPYTKSVIAFRNFNATGAEFIISSEGYRFLERKKGV